MFIGSLNNFPDRNFLRSVTNQCYLVDKSNFIKQVINSKEQAILIMRPHKWGKSLNLSMLNYFFRIELDKEMKPMRQSKHRVLFEGGEFQLNGNSKQKPNTIELNRINIAKDEQWQSKYSTHLGKYPVIYIDWGNIRKVKFETCLKYFAGIISSLFRSFHDVSEYLQNKQDHQSKENYKKFKNIKDFCSTQKDLEESLSFLVKLLHKIYQKKVVVLIDGYDSAYVYMLMRQLQSSDGGQRKQIKKDREELVDFISQILKSLEENKDILEKVVIVGILDILPKTKDNSDVPFLGKYGMLDERFSQSFGFTEEEVKTLINKIVSPQADSHKNQLIQNISSWYKGYVRPFSSQKQIFDPYSVISYLRECYLKKGVQQFQSFSSSDISNVIIRKMISVDQTIVNKLLQLNENTPTTLAINENFNLGNQYFWGVYEVHWSRLFLNLGRLTGNVQRNSFYALVPNRQLSEEFTNQINRDKELKENETFCTETFTTDSIKLKKQMENYLNRTRRSFASSNQSLFINLFAGRYLLLQGEKTHQISVKLQSGFGTIDTLFVPTQKYSSCIIIHQYKFFRDSNKNSSNLLNTLWSAYQKSYFEQPLLIAAECPWIKYIIIRPIVIYDPDTSEDISLEIEDVCHTVEEVQKISQFFARKQTTEILNLSNGNREQSHEALLKKFEIKGNLFELLEQIPTILERDTPKEELVKCESSDERNVASVKNELKEPISKDKS